VLAAVRIEATFRFMRPATADTHEVTDSCQVTSGGSITTPPTLWAEGFLAVPNTWYPSPASSAAAACPTPRGTPVTSTTDLSITIPPVRGQAARVPTPQSHPAAAAERGAEPKASADRAGRPAGLHSEIIWAKDAMTTCFPGPTVANALLGSGAEDRFQQAACITCA
jgi:hypothetical protein